MKVTFCWRVFFSTKNIEKAHRVWKRTGIEFPPEAQFDKSIYEKYWKTGQIVASFFYTQEIDQPVEKIYFDTSILLRNAVATFRTGGPFLFENGCFECNFSMQDPKTPGIDTLFLDIFSDEYTLASKPPSS